MINLIQKYSKWVQGFRPHFCVLVCVALIIFYPSKIHANDQTNTLLWDVQRERVTADIDGWDVKELLEHVSVATGWNIFVDPEGITPISVKFKDYAVGEALHAMLGKLNFVVVPQTNAPSRLYVFRTSVKQATREVAQGRKMAKPVPNELVVTLKPDSKTSIDELAKLYGAKVIGKIRGQNAYLLQFNDASATQAARQLLADNPDIGVVDSNYPLESPPLAVALEGGAASLQLKPRAPDSNQHLVVGLIDTTVQSLGANLDAFIKPQLEAASQQTTSTANQLNHGTAMAETILNAVQKQTGGSTSVSILPVDVYGGAETTTTFDVANGIKMAIDNGATSINLSLGGTGDSQVLHDVIIQASKQGIPIFAAAGNSPVTTPTYPAAYPEVTAVTATDSSGNIASYANRGSFVSMTAPGENFVSFNGLVYDVQGTSTSTAFVSGMAAGLADASHASSDQESALLKKTVPQSSLLKSLH